MGALSIAKWLKESLPYPPPLPIMDFIKMRKGFVENGGNHSPQ
jgi:hypothetical protein